MTTVKKTDIFALTFKVKSLDVGTEVTVLAKDILVAYKENPDNDPIDVDIDDATYKFSVAAPKSSNADLAGITVLNGTLTPAFSKDIL